MTSELQQNRYDRLIRRVGGIIGVGSKVSEVLSELFPVIDVEGDRGELQLLAQTVLGMGNASLTGDAGETAKAQLFNPVDSGKLVTVTDIFISSNTHVQSYFLGRSTIVLPSGIGTQLARDTRQSLVNRPVGAMFTDSSAAFADANITVRAAANVTLHVHAENNIMVLAPGNGLTLGASVLASHMALTFLWRERTAEQSELNI